MTNKDAKTPKSPFQIWLLLRAALWPAGYLLLLVLLVVLVLAIAFPVMALIELGFHPVFLKQWPIAVTVLPAYAIGVILWFSWILRSSIWDKIKLPRWCVGSWLVIGPVLLYIVYVLASENRAHDWIYLFLAVVVSTLCVPYVYSILAVKDGEWLPKTNGDPIITGSQKASLNVTLSLLLFWTLISAFGPFKEPLLSKPDRLRDLYHNSQWQDVRVGIALSGGGSRAALVHAGVLAMLETLQIPVTHLSTVSGGSIIGGFYALGGEPQDFVDAIIHHRFNLVRSLISMQNLVRLPLPVHVPWTDVSLLPWWEFSRSDVQASMLDTLLFQEKQLKDTGECEASNEKHCPPRLMIDATDLNSGDAVGLIKQGILLVPPPNGREKAEFGNRKFSKPDFKSTSVNMFPGNEPVARLVSASGAFPLAFSPFYYSLIKQDKTDLLLADGGLRDNSGLTLLLTANDLLEDWQVDIVLSSDASQIFKESVKLKPEEQMMRGIDIMYTAVGMTPRYFNNKTTTPPTVLLSPAMLVGTDAGWSEALKQSEAIKKFQATETDICSAFPKLVESLHKQLEDATSNPNKDRQVRIAANSLYSDFENFPDSLKNKKVEATSITETVDDKQLGSLTCDLFKSLVTFLSTSTLKDQLNKQEAGELFRLGQYLVLLNFSELKTKLGTPDKTKVRAAYQHPVS